MLVLESCQSLFLLLIKGRELRFPDPSEVEGEGSSDSAGAGIASVSVYNVSFLGQCIFLGSMRTELEPRGLQCVLERYQLQSLTDHREQAGPFPETCSAAWERSKYSVCYY